MRTSALVLAVLLCATSANARPPAPQDVVDKTTVSAKAEAEGQRLFCESVVKANEAIRLSEQATLTKHLIATGAVTAVAPHNDYSAYGKMDRTEMLAAISERQRANSRWMEVFCPVTAPPTP